MFSFYCSMFMVYLHFHCRLAPPPWVKFRSHFHLSFVSYYIIPHISFFFSCTAVFLLPFFLSFFSSSKLDSIASHCHTFSLLFFSNFLIYQSPFPLRTHTRTIYTHTFAMFFFCITSFIACFTCTTLFIFKKLLKHVHVWLPAGYKFIYLFHGRLLVSTNELS